MRPIMVRLAACIGPMQKPSSSAKPMNTYSCTEPNRPRVARIALAGTTKNTRSGAHAHDAERGHDHAGDGDLHGALAADQRSSSLPPRKAPGMANTVRMMPKMPSVMVLQPKVAEA